MIYGKLLKKRDNIIKKATEDKNCYLKNISNIYIEEEMYDKLYNLVKTENIYTIITYEKYLLPQYNQELINIYIEYCREFAANTNNRSLYKKLATYLRHIKYMEDSDDEYQQLMDEIATTYYQKRPAMKDELRGL